MKEAQPSRRARTTRTLSSRSGAPRPTAPLVELRRIPLDQIDTPRRPVRRFLGDIAALADSMQEYGLQQPISVRQADGRFHLTSGLRRFHAAKLLGWTTIPVFVRNVGADEAYLVDLVENLQREDLSPEEEADALGELIRGRGWTLEQVASAIKRSVGYVSKRVRVFEDPALRQAVTQRGLAVSTAEELLGFEPDQRPAAVERAVSERWDQVSVREALARTEAAEQVPRAPASLNLGTARSTNGVHRSGGAADIRADLGGQRPRGFTRAVREFHQMILSVRIEDLSGADRSALRSLFRDLVVLARDTAEKRQPVFPPLPSVPQSRPERASPSRSARR
jgi:ParB family chromosome partitioning protein